jgi:hypothetical protein
MNEKVYEDGKKAAKTPIMLCYARFNVNILPIFQWHNQPEASVNDVQACIMANPSSDW